MFDRRVAVGVLLAGSAFVGGCTGDDAADADRRAQIAAAYADVAATVAAGDAVAACERLGPRGRTQVRNLGHHILQDCPTGIRPLLARFDNNARGVPGKLGKVRIKVTAVATVSIEGRSIKVPFIEEAGEWKLDAFYGLSPRPSVAIP